MTITKLFHSYEELTEMVPRNYCYRNSFSVSTKLVTSVRTARTRCPHIKSFYAVAKFE